MLLYAPVVGATTSTPRSPTSSAASTRTRSLATSCATLFDLDPSGASWARAGGGGSGEAVARRGMIDVSPRRTQDRRRPVTTDASQRRPQRRQASASSEGVGARCSPTSPTRTSPPRRTAPGCSPNCADHSPSSIGNGRPITGVDPSTGESCYTWHAAGVGRRRDRAGDRARRPVRRGVPAERRTGGDRPYRWRCARRLPGSSIAAMVHDGGKTVAEADVEVSEAVDFARYYASSRGSARRAGT